MGDVQPQEARLIRDCVKEDRPNVLEFMIENLAARWEVKNGKVLIQLANSKGQTFIHLAAKANATDIIDYCLKEAHFESAKIGNDTDDEDTENTTNGNVKVKDDARIAFVNGQDDHGLTSLMIAAGEGNIDSYDLFEGQDRERRDHDDVVEILITNGIDAKIVNSNGQTGMDAALMNSADDTIPAIHYCLDQKRFLESERDLRKAFISQKDNHNPTALHTVAKRGLIDTYGALLEAEADQTAKDDKGQNLLHFAAASGNKDSDNHQTALHVAAANNHTGIVIFPLEKGIDPHIEDEDEETAMPLAYTTDAVDVVDLFVERELWEADYSEDSDEDTDETE
ncbi:Uu.00g057410.m01.CDS01 [Anthostomella pinea]|uniref:Uu.00g057410.m01.CDS01 n=1 Tax=Anthostomella pinea TaxID=933095 RepID=A0AAI8YJR9_9PEZI|nr:Uu.00g057410.m01.CDS01 [Anthostomella pinea]